MRKQRPRQLGVLCFSWQGVHIRRQEREIWVPFPEGDAHRALLALQGKGPHEEATKARLGLSFPEKGNSGARRAMRKQTTRDLGSFSEKRTFFALHGKGATMKRQRARDLFFQPEKGTNLAFLASQGRSHMRRQRTRDLGSFSGKVPKSRIVCSLFSGKGPKSRVV